MKSKNMWNIESKRNYWQLVRAINHLDILQVIKALDNGSVIDYSDTKKNTMNHCIRASLSIRPSKFNIIFIQQIIDLGAKPCKSINIYTGKDTLVMILRVARKIREKTKNYYLIHQNIVLIIKLLIIHGIDMDTTESSLYLAAMTNNPEILELIIITGGFEIMHGIDNCMYKQIANINRDSTDRQHIDKMIFLLMCSGAIPCNDNCYYDFYGDEMNTFHTENENYKIFVLKKERSYIESRIITCYELLNPQFIIFSHCYQITHLDNYLNHVKEMRNGLRNVMKELVEKKIGSREINSAIIAHVPTCLVNLICDYYSEKNIRFIDWMQDTKS